MKTKSELKSILSKSKKGNVRVKHYKVGQWDRYYLYNVRKKSFGSPKKGGAYYTTSLLEKNIKYGQIKSIV